MRVRSGIIIVISLILLPMCLRAQQSIVFSQYLYNGLLINPAYAGSHVQFSATLTYRNQWVNFEGAPETSTLGVHTSLRKGQLGVGLLTTLDRIGSYNNTSFYPSFSYKIKDPVSRGVFSFGLQAGFNNYRADFSKLNLKAGQDPIFNVLSNEFRPNFGAGVFYYNDKMFAGFSVPTILTNFSLSSSTLEALRTPRYYYLNAGLKLPLDPRTKKVMVHPSFLLRAQDGTPISIDLNLQVVFDQTISLGTSYRTGDGLVMLVNYKLSDKVYIGYSYDWTTSDIRRYSKGSHEIMINYRTRIRRIHQNLDCPHVYSH